MTENEAKTKWCPFSRVAASGNGWPAYNRTSPPSELLPRSTLCVGSDCMAWRTHNEGKSGFCGLATNLYTVGTI